MFYSPILLNFIIPSGLSLSGNVNVSGLHLLEIRFPDAWDAANITFSGSLDDVNFSPFSDFSGAEVVVVGSAFSLRRLNPVIFQPTGLRFLRVRSGTAAAPVTQTAQRTVVVSAVQRQ